MFGDYLLDSSKQWHFGSSQLLLRDTMASRDIGQRFSSVVRLGIREGPAIPTATGQLQFNEREKRKIAVLIAT